VAEIVTGGMPFRGQTIEPKNLGKPALSPQPDNWIPAYAGFGYWLIKR